MATAQYDGTTSAPNVEAASYETEEFEPQEDYGTDTLFDGEERIGEYGHEDDIRDPEQPSVEPGAMSVPLPENDILIVLGGALFRRPGGGRERDR